jgi:hypothetical protein
MVKRLGLVLPLLFVVGALPIHSSRAKATNCGVWTVASPTTSVSKPYARLFGVAVVSAGDVWVAGTNGGTYTGRPLLEHWNGTAWRTANVSGLRNQPGIFYSVSAVSSRDVWAVGAYQGDLSALAAHWNGTSWKAVAVPKPDPYEGALYKLWASSSKSVWASGSWSEYDGLVMHWNGSKWSLSDEEGSTQGFGDISGSGDHDVWAVGPISAVHWNGKAWARVPTGSLDARVVADIAKTDTWLFGVAGNKLRAEFAHWNGKLISTSAAPDQGKYQPQVLALYAAGNADVWAAGASGPDPFRPPFYSPTKASGRYSSLIEHWNGKAWSVVAGSVQHAGFSAIAGAKPGDVWAVGEVDAKGNPHPLAEHYLACPPA